MIDSINGSHKVNDCEIMFNTIEGLKYTWYFSNVFYMVPHWNNLVQK